MRKRSYTSPPSALRSRLLWRQQHHSATSNSIQTLRQRLPCCVGASRRTIHFPTGTSAPHFSQQWSSPSETDSYGNPHQVPTVGWPRPCRRSKPSLPANSKKKRSPNGLLHASVGAISDLSTSSGYFCGSGGGLTSMPR